MSTFDPNTWPDPGDPAEAIDALHASGPVVATDAGLVCVVTHEAAGAVFREPSVFRSGPIGEAYRHALPEGAARDEFSNRINFLDPPEHTRVRTAVSRLFTPRQAEGLRPWVHDLAAKRLAEIGSGEVFDALADYAHQVPTATVSELLGVPLADRDELTAWTEATSPLLGLHVPADQKTRALDAAEQFHAYMRGLFDERRAAPRDDLLTRISSDGEMTDPEKMSLVVTLYSAGHRTTRDLFVNGLHTMLTTAPDRYGAVAADPALVAPTIRECLRHATPTTFVARVTNAPAVVAGTELGAGSVVIVVLLAANRDPAAYPDPHRFDPGRADQPDPLSFALGPHRCLGAALATMEAEEMLRALTERFVSVEPAGATPQWHQTGPFRGLDALTLAG